MADDVAGAVRRTPRPTPRTDDHQTPETDAPVAPGATNPATPVSQDAGSGSDDLRRVFRCAQCGADRWVGWRAGPEHEGYPRKAQCVPCGHVQELPPLPPLARPVVLAGPECDMEAYAALPPCKACEGGGQDTHGTVFEAPLAVHFAGPPVEIAGRRRQLCMWCGHVLLDSSGAIAPPWPTGVLVRIEDGMGSIEPHEPGEELPPGCCALPDDHEPADDGLCERCSGLAVEQLSFPGQRLCQQHLNQAFADEAAAEDQAEDDGPDEAQETRAAADWPAEPEETDHA